MEEWRIHRLYESTESGERYQVGGAITELKIGAVNGSLSEISVTPVSEDERDEFRSVAFMRMQVADRVVWMEPDEVETLVELLKIAHDASLRDFRPASP